MSFIGKFLCAIGQHDLEIIPDEQGKTGLSAGWKCKRPGCAEYHAPVEWPMPEEEDEETPQNPWKDGTLPLP